ncbi:cellulase [Chaetomium strumarium]|uniref:Glucanase n=1 Tax=Chaetomium strumarium TaxID=1170767 RepID=A0AAJ0M169_9PEZI|nr:cellulase [Chaetomium strumarium]
MARGIALLSLASALLGVAHGQKPGSAKEVHPKITTYRCSNRGGCKAQTNYIVLDSLAHPIHQATSLANNCGDWGSKPNATACPDKESCAKNCIMEGIPDYSQYGVTTQGTALRLQQLLDGRLVTPRVYLLDKSEQRYEMMHLAGAEFAFEVDAAKLPCGMNSALYLSEMHPTGARSKLNPGGAYYGTGYCDAQCFVTPFINGVGNIEGHGSCCNEMDIWEANARATHLAPHPCNKPGLYLCSGDDECGDDGVCDKDGCAWNPYRVNVTDYYGASARFRVDTTRPFTVVTQFLTSTPNPPQNGKGHNKKKELTKIHRLYVQDDKVIESYTVDAPGLPKTDSLTDEFCGATGAAKYLALGGTRGIGEALERGMVLAMSIWWDEGGNMNWLDSGEAGPCDPWEGNPANITKVEPGPEVTFRNLRWGEIGSTFGDRVRL